MAVITENGSGDQFVPRSEAAAATAAAEKMKGKECETGVGKLDELLSKLNPSAEEFVPSSRPAPLKPQPRLSADAPSFPRLSADAPSFDYVGTAPRRRGFGLGGRRDEQIRRTLYVSDLDQTVSEEMLAGVFSNWGDVVDCRICGDPRSLLRFAFVEFSKESEAKCALQLDATLVGGYHIRVLPSKTAIVPVNPRFLPQSENEREMVGRTIYCTNIDKQVTQTYIKRYFEDCCGEVRRLRLLLDNKHSTCIAFVEFVQAESAHKALACSGVLLGANRIRVSPSKTPVRPRVHQIITS